MPLIDPPERVAVDTGQLHTLVATVRLACHIDGTPFRPEIVTAADHLKESLLFPRILNNPTTEVLAEELWWVVQAADQLGNDRCLSPIGVLFTAVDDLALALEHQAPRTDRALVVLLEAEAALMLTGNQEDNARE
ncbi:hypothetical protein KIK06_23500 [Nocardiopsis sp. EMB25]|uniref:hypothetical protein n=1 Tax=Nocardiopsis sp. EMB25 TaxID=2835867 RepID=UPI0022853A7B|nr:hypothetical protein [Nocardiopsis sp. EMB25]MCY9786853.1 hypothetical protein [Nocardiopsis sp. EMB25]